MPSSPFHFVNSKNRIMKEFNEPHNLGPEEIGECWRQLGSEQLTDGARITGS